MQLTLYQSSYHTYLQTEVQQQATELQERDAEISQLQRVRN